MRNEANRAEPPTPRCGDGQETLSRADDQVEWRSFSKRLKPVVAEGQIRREAVFHAQSRPVFKEQIRLASPGKNLSRSQDTNRRIGMGHRRSGIDAHGLADGCPHRIADPVPSPQRIFVFVIDSPDIGTHTGCLLGSIRSCATRAESGPQQRPHLRQQRTAHHRQISNHSWQGPLSIFDPTSPPEP